MRLFTFIFCVSIILNSPCALSAAAGGDSDDRIQRWRGPLGMNFVRVGAPGNAQDERDPGWRRFGAVDYVYWISETEVTNAMYTAFLNSVATQSDPHELWTRADNRRWFDDIIRIENEDGTYYYETVNDTANHPVVRMYHRKIFRFMNWLHNGMQDNPATTEYGACDTSTWGNDEQGRYLESLDHEPEARYWLPSEDEWYKAAYYEPGRMEYWWYPTSRGRDDPPDVWDQPGANPFNSAIYATAYSKPVGMLPFTRTPWGALDMAGNARDYLAKWYTIGTPYGEAYVTRGAVWGGAPLDEKTARTVAGAPFGKNTDWDWKSFRIVARLALTDSVNRVYRVSPHQESDDMNMKQPLNALAVGMMSLAATAAHAGGDPNRPIELWRLDNGVPVFVRNAIAGANIIINETDGGAASYLICDFTGEGAGNDPSYSVGIIEVAMDNPVSGTVDILFAESFNQLGMDYAGVVNCKGVARTNPSNPNVRVTLRGWMTGDFLNGRPGEDILVDQIIGLEILGEIRQGTWIKVEESIDQIFAKRFGGGVLIECLGDGGSGDIDTIRAGWTTEPDPNTHTMGAPGDPVVVRADFVAGQNIITGIRSLGDMHLDVSASGYIDTIRTSWSTNVPSGLTSYDAVVDAQCSVLFDMKIPFASNGIDVGDLSGEIRTTKPSGFSPAFDVSGVFDGKFIIDAGFESTASIKDVR